MDDNNKVRCSLTVVKDIIKLSFYYPNYCYDIHFQTLNDLKTYLQDNDMYELYETIKDN